MRSPHTFSHSIVLILLLSLAGCSWFDGERTHSESERPAPPVPVKDARTLGTPLEKDFGYVQAVKMGETIYVSGQLSLDDKGTLNGKDMETQLWQVYANIGKVLGLYGARMKDVVEEVIYVTDLQAALAVAPKVRRGAYAEQPQVASTIVQVAHLSVPEAMVEIKVTAMAPAPPPRATKPSDSQGQSQGGRRGRGGGLGLPF